MVVKADVFILTKTQTGSYIIYIKIGGGESKAHRRFPRLGGNSGPHFPTIPFSGVVMSNNKIAKVMKEYKKGKSSGKRIKSKKQAIAIALNSSSQRRKRKKK